MSAIVSAELGNYQALYYNHEVVPKEQTLEP